MPFEHESCHVTLRYTEAGDSTEGHRLLDEAGVHQVIDMLVTPPLFTARVVQMPTERLNELISALASTGATVSKEPDAGPLIGQRRDL